MGQRFPNRMDRLMSTQLETIPLFNAEGEPVPLGSVWTKTPVVVVFVRHFG